MRFKRTVIGMGMALAMLTSWAQAEVTPQVFLSISDTVLCPGDPGGRQLTIRLNNTVKVGGYQVALSITDPSIINFKPNGNVDTTPPHWRYFIDCSPPPCHQDSVFECPDTCFVPKIDVIIAGTRSSNFASVEGTLLSEIVAQVTGFSFTAGDPGPALQPGNGILFRVPLTIFPISDSVPLSQRQVLIQIDPAFTFISDSTGNITYRASDSSLQVTNGTVTVPFSTKGDLNFDCVINSVDVVLLLSWVFAGTPEPLPDASTGDVNCDGTESPIDVVLLLNKVFAGTDLPC